jgi:ankyrin repeat protein
MNIKNCIVVGLLLINSSYVDSSINTSDKVMTTATSASIALVAVITVCLALENVDEPLIEALKSHDSPTTRILRTLFYGDEMARVPELINSGADVNAKENKTGISALQLAVYYNLLEIAQLLIDRGASLDVQDKRGCTPLMYAIFRGHDDMVTLLLKAGARIDLKAADGSTAIGYAVLRGNVSIAETLLRYGTDVNVPIDTGLTPLMMAAGNGSEKMVDLLLKAGADVNAVMKAKNDSGWKTALWFAALGGHVNIVELLIKAGAKIDYDNPNIAEMVGRVPRHVKSIICPHINNHAPWCKRYDSIELVESLLKIKRFKEL